MHVKPLEITKIHGGFRVPDKIVVARKVNELVDAVNSLKIGVSGGQNSEQIQAQIASFGETLSNLQTQIVAEESLGERLSEVEKQVAEIHGKLGLS
jgi:hypothetical protein